MTKHSPPPPPAAPARPQPGKKAKSMARILIWTGRALAGVVALILMLGLGLMLFAYSPSGGPALARLTSGLINGLNTGIELKVGSIRLQWPLRLMAQDVHLTDYEGEWLNAPLVEVSLKPASLLPSQGAWQLQAQTALVRQAVWSRLPVFAPEPEGAEPAPLQEPTPLTLMPDWLSVVADSILLEDVRIGAAALGLSPQEPYIPAFSSVQMALQGHISALRAQAEIHAEIRPVPAPAKAPTEPDSTASPENPPVNPAATPANTPSSPAHESLPTGPPAVTRLLLKAEWKDNTLTLNNRIEDTALLAPHLPEPSLPIILRGTMPKDQASTDQANTRQTGSDTAGPQTLPLTSGPTESPLPPAHLAILGDITMHLPVIPPVAAQPMRINWALNSSSPGLPNTLFSGDLRIDDAGLSWENVSILYPPPKSTSNAEKPEDAASSTQNSLRSEGSFHFRQGPTAQLDLHLHDVGTLSHFGLRMPEAASGPLNASLQITPAALNLDIQSPSLVLAQGALQGLNLKIQAKPVAPKAEAPKVKKPKAEQAQNAPQSEGQETKQPKAATITAETMQPAVPSHSPAWELPTNFNGTLELKVQSCMGFGPLNLSTSWGLENILSTFGARLADLQADMLGVKLRGGLAYSDSTFTDAALDLAVTDTSALAKLLNIPLKGCPLTFKARIAPETKEKTIKGLLHFGAGSYDSFEWLSGEGDVQVDSTKASLSLSVKGKLSARVRCSYNFKEQLLRIDNVEMGDTKRKLGAKLLDPTEIRFANGISIGETNISLRPSGMVHIKGTLESQKLNLEATIADLPLAMGKAFITSPIPQGLLSARVGLKGSPSAPAGDILVRVDNMQLASTVDGPKASLVVDGTLKRATVQGGGSHSLHLQSHWEGLESLKDFKATAQIPLHFSPTPTLLMNGPLRAELFWQGDIAPLWRLVPLPGRSMSGKAEVQAQVTGSLHKPVLTGQAFVGQGRFVDSVDGLLLDGISLEARYDAQKQSLLRLQATDGRGGSLNLDGSLSAHGTMDSATLALHGIINKLRPLRRDDVAVQLSGTVDITGPLTAPLVAAKLCVDQGLLQLLDGFGGASIKSLPIEERKAIAGLSKKAQDSAQQTATAPSKEKSPKRETKKGKTTSSAQSAQAALSGPSGPSGASDLGQPPSPLAPALVPRCDIHITAPGRLYIRGKGLDSEWKANLRLSGPLADPQIVGNVTPIRGNLELLGHQFTLASGDIAFTGSLPPNPALDVSLQYKSADITALIVFSGSAKQPKMRLSSQPVLPNDEIIAQILFGKNINSLSRFEALQAANTARQLVDLGPSSLDIMSTTRDLLGLEVLRLGSATANRQTHAPRDASMQGTSSANPDEQAPTIEAGKYILDNVYVGFEQGTDAKTGTIVRVEVELMPNLSLEGRTSNESTGVGINWKRDY